MREEGEWGSEREMGRGGNFKWYCKDNDTYGEGSLILRPFSSIVGIGTP